MHDLCRQMQEELLEMEPLELSELDDEAFEVCLRVLRSLMGKEIEGDRRVDAVRVMCAMYRRSLRKSRRSLKKKERLEEAAKLLGEVGLRHEDRESLRRDAGLLLPQEAGPELPFDRSCYQCKERFRTLHHFYDCFCPSCAAFNLEKRYQRASLSGRCALVTGGRIKIGFELALKMLRDGARVFVTTRFPRDAVRRYAEVEDFELWHERLHVVGLDLRDVRGVEAFCGWLGEQVEGLDIVCHNAAQTVRRPAAYYRDALDVEACEELGQRELKCLVSERWGLLEMRPCLPSGGEEDAELFPVGEYDEDGLQRDLRERNSWTMALEDVSALELLEVHVINTVAPALMNARLKPLMKRSAHEDRYIVNVTAKEGQFHVNYKSIKHPHTNMAKASLNMMTRTSAVDYARDGIYMTSVDTGWVTFEQPAHIKERWLEQGRWPPLDVVEGAARVYDPIVRGVRYGERLSGKLYVNYQEAPW